MKSTRIPASGLRRAVQYRLGYRSSVCIGRWRQTAGLHFTSPDAAVRREMAEYLSDPACLRRELGGTILVLGSPQQRNLLPGVTSQEAMDYATDVIQQGLACWKKPRRFWPSSPCRQPTAIF